MKLLKSLNKYKYVIVCYVLLIISILPLLSLCSSAIPSADDFTNGLKARHAFVRTGSVLSAISAAWESTRECYMTFQGTYSSVFIMSIQPAVFSLALYRAAAYILIILTIVCPIILTRVIDRYIFDSKGTVLYYLTCICTFLFIQFMPSVFEGFYWFCGAWYYTFTFNMVLLFVSHIIILKKTKSKSIRITMFVLLLLGAIFLGGTNLPQVLYLTVASTIYIFYIFFIKKDKHRWYLVSVWILLGICITINVFSPGNIQVGKGHVSLVYTTLTMIRGFAIELSATPSNYILLAVCACTTPMILRLTDSTKVKYMNPIFILAFSFVVIFSMYTPAAFVFNNIGPVRSQNIRMLMIMIAIVVNYINLCGYLYSRGSNEDKPRPSSIVLVLLAVIMVMTGIQNESIMSANAIKAQYSITGLQVSNFTQRMDDLFEQLEDESIKSITVEPLPTHSMLLPDMVGFKAFGMWYFYDKDEVIY